MKQVWFALVSALASIVGCGDDSTSGGGGAGGETSGGGGAGVEFLDPTEEHLGSSYQEWAAKWWQWTYSLPATNHPLLDATGEFCQVGQTGDVFFLGGTSGGEPVARECTVGSDKTLFFPIVNTSFDNGGIEPADHVSDAENQAGATAFIDSVEEYSLTIDGTTWSKADLQAYRVGPYESSYSLPEQDNLFEYFGLPVAVVGTVEPTFGDGVYVMVARTPGPHTVVILASTTNGTPDPADDFTLDVTYDLTIE